MGRRTDLHTILVNLLGSNHVYFQPPETIIMEYPCIVYEWSSNQTKFADDNPYFNKRKYSVTVIDRNPDSEIPDKVAGLPSCTFDRGYQKDNLNHYSFIIYY
jgi:hypothetical protein